MSSSSARRAATRVARARQAATGERYAEARRNTGAPTPDPRRTATATITLTGSRWRIATSDGSYPEDRGILSWRNRVPLTDRACFLEQAARELDLYGWDITGGPQLPDPVPTTVTLALVRNDRGVELDEVERLYAAAGVSIFDGHAAYIDACAEAVTAAGMPIYGLYADGGEPREGCFYLGEQGGSDEPCSAIVWRDNMGWYLVEHQDHRGGLGDGPFELPDLYGLTPPPHEVAAAVLRAFPVEYPVEIQPWPTPDGYDPNPPMADDDGFSVSAALERSLVAYTEPDRRA